MSKGSENSAEVVEFMQLFARLKEFCDDIRVNSAAQLLIPVWRISATNFLWLLTSSR